MRILTILPLLVLAASAQARTLRLAIVGDPQVDNPTQLVYAQRSIYKDLRERKDLDMVLVLGDLVNDKPSLLEPSVASLDSLNCPWFAVPGNHDRDMEKGKRRLTNSFRCAVGYVDTSFVKKDTRFILLNDVYTKGRADYEGRLTISQKHYLDSLLKLTPRDMQVVLATHIPISECKDLDTLKTILSQHPRLLLCSAHTHTVIRHQIDQIDELIAGTTCGSFWRGEKDENGIPYSLQSCGAPRGYFIADISSRDYRLQFIPLRKDKTSFNAYIVEDKLIVNIFAGAVGGEARVKLGGDWYNLEPYDGMAPEVAKLRDEFNSLSKEYRREHKEEIIPLWHVRSAHLWYIPLENLGNNLQETMLMDYKDPHYRIRRAKFSPIR